jgi:hypothetical protein
MFPCGSQWTYPIDQYNKVGDPACTQALGVDHLRIHTDDIRKFTYNFDYKMFTLHSKEHWRLFIKFGEKPDSLRPGWTGDLGFSLVASSYHPLEKFSKKRTPGPLFKITSYQGITGILEDRKGGSLSTSNELVASGMRVNIYAHLDPGHKKLNIDFWPFLKFMMDKCHWVGGYPLATVMGSEIYNSATDDNNKAVGASIIHKFERIIQSDIKSKVSLKGINIFRKESKIDLLDFITIPEKPPLRADPGEVKHHVLNDFKPRFKIIEKLDDKDFEAHIENSILRIKILNKSVTRISVKIRSFEKYYKWFDEKELHFRINDCRD